MKYEKPLSHLKRKTQPISGFVRQALMQGNLMLDELRRGEGYMKLPWKPAKRGQKI